jgi:iron complex transport system permease protein
MGSLSHVSLDTVLLCVVPVFLIIVSLLWVAPQLNACSLGENQAKALGVNLVLLRLVVIGGCTALSALTVTLAGMIGWVGLAVPHIVRLLMGSNARITIPCSALGGSLFLLATDNISRNFTTSEIPVGILTSLVGIPVFAWALKKAESRWVSC